jgi:hypothetical protein
VVEERERERERERISPGMEEDVLNKLAGKPNRFFGSLLTHASASISNHSFSFLFLFFRIILVHHKSLKKYY